MWLPRDVTEGSRVAHYKYFWHPHFFQENMLIFCQIIWSHLEKSQSILCCDLRFWALVMGTCLLYCSSLPNKIRVGIPLFSFVCFRLIRTYSLSHNTIESAADKSCPYSSLDQPQVKQDEVNKLDSVTAAKQPRDGPHWIQGYSTEYPLFLNKKFSYIVYLMYMIQKK